MHQPLNDVVRAAIDEALASGQPPDAVLQEVLAALATILGTASGMLSAMRFQPEAIVAGLSAVCRAGVQQAVLARSVKAEVPKQSRHAARAMASLGSTWALVMAPSGDGHSVTTYVAGKSEALRWLAGTVADTALIAFAGQDLPEDAERMVTLLSHRPAGPEA